MRILVDTHAFLWQLLADPRSSKKSIRILSDETHDLVFSIVSLWEIAINMQLGRLKQMGSSVAFIREQMALYGIELLPLRYEHILAMESLPMHHRDPFDRMLIAQAQTEELPILTKDREFARYGIKTIW